MAVNFSIFRRGCEQPKKLVDAKSQIFYDSLTCDSFSINLNLILITFLRPLALGWSACKLRYWTTKESVSDYQMNLNFCSHLSQKQSILKRKTSLLLEAIELLMNNSKPF